MIGWVWLRSSLEATISAIDRMESYYFLVKIYGLVVHGKYLKAAEKLAELASNKTNVYKFAVKTLRLLPIPGIPKARFFRSFL
jgi:hypothetical protein